MLEFKELVDRIAENAQSEWEKANDLAQLFEMESGTGLCFSTNRKQPLAWVYSKAYETPQQFHGYASEEGQAVDIQGYVRLCHDGHELPELLLRIVAEQHDDLLIAAPDLDYLGWQRGADD